MTPSLIIRARCYKHYFKRFSPFKNAFSLPHVLMMTPIDDTGIFSNAYDDGVLEELDMNSIDSSYAIPEATKNKKAERGIVIKIKARLVAHGHTQEEGIDYDEVFVLVARMEAIRLFLAYASFKYFVAYQMDIKSAFLYEKIEDKVYVCQPPSFEDPNIPDKVYKVEKALYGLHQAPRAWCETLSTYLLDNGFHKGQIDKTLFITRHKDNILLVQVYVDDIIFGSTKKELSTEFEKLMQDKFQMSSMGELSFFLGHQVKQKSDGIFISQDKYPLIKDDEAEDVDVHVYRSMIGSLMYLTASRPDITFVVCACASLVIAKDGRCFVDTFEVTTAELAGFEQIIDFLKSKPIHYALTVNPTIYVSCVRQFWSTKKVKRVNDQEHIQALVDKKKVIITKDCIRSDLRFDDAEGTACLPNEKKQQPRRKQRQEVEVSHDESEDENHVPTPSSNPLPSGEDSYTLNELMVFGRRVKSPLEKDNLGAKEDASKHERMIDEIDQDDEIEVVLDTTTGEHEEQLIEDVSTAKPVTTAGEVVTIVADKVSVAPTTDVTEDEITMAQALAALKSTKPKVVVPEQEVSTTILVAATIVTTDVPTLRAKDKNVEPVIDDTEELKKCMEIVPDNGDEVLIEATPISYRSPTIIDYKIYKEGKKSYFKIIIADDSEDSIVTYKEVSSSFEGLSDIGYLGVEGLPMMPEDPYAYVVATFQAPPSPDYVPGLEEPEQAPPLPEFVPEPMYLEFMPLKDEILPAKEQPLPAEDPTDYPANGGDNDDDDDGSFDDYENDDDVRGDEEEHLALTVSIPPPLVHHVTARMSIKEQEPTPVWSEVEIDRLLAILSPPPSPLSPWSSPLLQIPSPPLLVLPHLLVSSPPLPASPTYPLGYKAIMIQMRAET
nr:copia protein [Tanacetum cinerariifolium]